MRSVGLVLPEEGSLQPRHLVGLPVDEDDVGRLELPDEPAGLLVVRVGREGDVVDLKEEQNVSNGKQFAKVIK